jgi:hypothetical protein
MSAAKSVAVCVVCIAARGQRATAPPGDRWPAPLLVVRFPVLAQQGDELF